jgi:hypothetical protein
MATSRPIQQDDRLVAISTPLHLGDTYIYNSNLVYNHNFVRGFRNRPIGALFVLAADFHLPHRSDHAWWMIVGERVFGIPSCVSSTDPRLAAAITNGTAPGLYVREGDDTSDWETYRQVLALRVEEAMATRRRGGAGGGETATAERAAPSRQDDEIRVGDVVEVVSWTGDDSPMSDQEAARITTAVTDEARRSLSSPLASNSDETTRRRVVNPVPPAVSVSLRPHDFTAAAITNYLQSLGATHTHVRQAPGSLPVVEVTGLSQQAFDRARQNLPVGIQLRAAGGMVGQRDSGGTTAARGVQSETPAAASPPPTPSRFSLLEVDLPPEPTSSNSGSLDADLAALQEELRVEREINRAQAAAQMQKSRFDLLECDLPAVPVAAAPVAAVAVKASPRPVVSSPPKSRNPVETITDLTTARSPLELARMLESLGDELSTMMRQREAN